MDFQIPPPDKIPYGMRAMKTVALADGDFDRTERALMEAAQELFGVKVDIDSLELITPVGVSESDHRSSTSLAALPRHDRDVTGGRERE